MMKTSYKTNQRIRISRRLVGKAQLLGEGWGGGLRARRGADVPEAMARSVQISGELELVDDARRLPKGLEARAGRGQSPPGHAGHATQAMPRRPCHAGHATPRGCGRCKCQPGDSTGAASGKQIGYVKVALQMRSFSGRRLASRAAVRGFLIPLLSMDAVRSSTTWGKWPGAWSCPPAVPATATDPSSLPAPSSLAPPAASCPSSQIFTILLIALNIPHTFPSWMSGCQYVANNTTYYTAHINLYIKTML